MCANWKTPAILLVLYYYISVDGFAQNTTSTIIYPHLTALRERYQHEFYVKINQVRAYEAMDTSSLVLKTFTKGEGYRLILVEDNDWLRIQFVEENEKKIAYLRWIDTKTDLTTFQPKKQHPQNLQMLWDLPGKKSKHITEWPLNLTVLNDHPLRDYSFQKGYLSLMLVNETDTLLHFIKTVEPFNVSELNQAQDTVVTDRQSIENGFVFYDKIRKGIFYKQHKEDEMDTLMFNYNNSKKNNLVAVYIDEQTLSEPLYSTPLVIGMLPK